MTPELKLLQGGAGDPLPRRTGRRAPGPHPAGRRTPDGPLAAFLAEMRAAYTLDPADQAAAITTAAQRLYAARSSAAGA